MPAALVSRQECSVDTRRVLSMATVLVEVPQQSMYSITGRAVLIEMHDQLVARVLFDELARGEVMLEIDNHSYPRMFLPGHLHIR